jgi:uncharacterized integral membrane protein
MGTQPVSATRSTEIASTDGTVDVEAVSPVVAAPPADVVSTRASRTWIKVLPGLILLAVLLMFVFQNLGKAKVSFATASGAFPLSLALLGAAALGGLSVLALGSVRILQLRKVIRRTHRGEK